MSGNDRTNEISPIILRLERRSTRKVELSSTEIIGILRERATNKCGQEEIRRVK